MKLNFVFALILLFTIQVSAQPQFVKDFGNPSSNPNSLTVAGNNIFFTTSDYNGSVDKHEIWAFSPASANGAATFKLLKEFKYYYHNTNFTSVGNKVFFQVYHPLNTMNYG